MSLHRWFPVSIPTAFLALVAAAPAFSPPVATEGPLTIRIADPGEVKALDKPVAVPVTLTNAGNEALAGSVRVWGVDGWRAEGEAIRKFSLPPKGTETIPFAVVPTTNSYAALYPVHAQAEFGTGKSKKAAHAILILSVAQEAVTKAAPAQVPVLRAPRRGPLRLDVEGGFQASIAVHDKAPLKKPIGWRGGDVATGGSVSLSDADRGERRRAFNIHPPYRGGWGELWLDWRVTLPNTKPIALEFATAIRDSDAKREGTSDGVDFRVQVGAGDKCEELFARFSAAKRWEPARVDLSKFAGREVTLRLVTGPGPKHNTSCDSSFWAEPTIWVGERPPPESAAERAARRDVAVKTARAALRGEKVEWAWRLESEAGRSGVAVTPGPNGLADACIAFSDGQREVMFDGFQMEVDGSPVAADKPGLVCESVEKRFSGGAGVLTHRLLKGDQSVPAQAKLWAEKGALRVAFSMPGVKRDKRGEPRFTTLAIGPASEKARRVYAGFGNVLQEPGKFDLSANGFQLSTRHVGVGFAGGLSLVQACDVFPDRFRVDPEARRYALMTHHDATLSFLPSGRGAFAAARVYRAIANFKPAGGVAKITGKMCLDQWGGDYREAADGLEKAARYGLTDAVFVKHVWQRWGYDYRLPDIYPPAGSQEDFMAMVAACKRNGILFCPHDNYIDFYPDAEGYSYKHIIFNPDGTPQKAWFNKGREAQSYRWLPTAFQPWLERNLRLIKRGFSPTSYFVDVFSAMPPVDFRDQEGRFYTKMACAERWGAAFDRIRSVLGNNAPQISEAGHDALIGHLDAGQADHMGWKPGQWRFAWGMDAGDVERVPWHDMASHGAFVLLAGGLGHRYGGETGDSFHGYGSDDYLSMTVLGGRNPMCDGPFSRRAVMTYWLLHDVCAELARREMLSHEFAGDDIHRQIVKFADGASVIANRDREDWQVEGVTLPAYGFVARAGNAEADVRRRDGLVTAMARSGHTLFVDARPPAADERRVARPVVTGVEDLGGGRMRLRFEWTVLQPVEAGWRPFVHFVDDKSSHGEGIAFQGHLKLDSAKLAVPGKVVAECDARLPENVKLPATFAVRCGLYNPGTGGARARLDGPLDSTGRVKCGQIVVLQPALGGASVRWEAEPVDPEAGLREARLNHAGRLVDFGPVATSGAFRLRYGPGAVWDMTPLPSSLPFRVELRLDRLGREGAKVRGVFAMDMEGRLIEAVPSARDGDALGFAADGTAFRYVVLFDRAHIKD